MSKFHKALEMAGKTIQPASEKKTVIQLKGFEPGIGRELIVIKEPDSEASEYFRFLRSWITRPAVGNPPRTILTTSALMEEGKTFVACNLAASISQSVEESALLIDTDLRKPKVHKMFGLPPNAGGLSAFEKDMPLSELVSKTSVEKLTVLQAGTSNRNPSELLASDKMKQMLLDVRNRYPDRFVVIDSSPVLLTPETSVLANCVDAVLLVVRYGKTPRHSVKAALEKIPEKKLLGVVFNADEKEGSGRYGGYKYGYGKDKKS